jgi:hypothetical protein
MCRNIRPLFNFEPPASEAEARDAALQFVRKLAGTTKPSKANERVFEHAVEEITTSVLALVRDLQTTAPPKNREIEAARARERSRRRFSD